MDVTDAERLLQASKDKSEADSFDPSNVVSFDVYPIMLAMPNARGNIRPSAIGPRIRVDDKASEEFAYLLNMANGTVANKLSAADATISSVTETIGKMQGVKIGG